MNTQLYEVDQILDEAIIGGIPHFLIKWKNHSHDDDTWESIDELSNISEYLQYWVSKKREKERSKLPHKKSNLLKIEQNTYQSPRVMKRGRKRNLQKYEQKLLNKQKTWQKYVNNQKYNKGQAFKNSECPTFYKKEQKDLISRMKSENVKQEELIFDEQNDQYLTKQEIQCQENKRFHVIGNIDPSQIRKILNYFFWNNTRCLQIEMKNGKHFNMKEEDLRLIKPEMLVDYYESINMPF